MNLSDVFSAVAHKELVAVDLPDQGSHQHELNGVTALKELFGTDREIRGQIRWHYFEDDRDFSREDGDFTFYDARARSADRTGRSEWRFYYSGDFLSMAEEGDLFVLTATKSREINGLVFQKNSAWHRAALVLFGIDRTRQKLSTIPHKELDGNRLELLRSQILSELELDIALPVAPTDEELMIETFDGKFPSTKEMSAFARSQTDADIGRPDETLVLWLEREEQLFRALEKVLIQERISKGFSDVDEFIKYSLSIQNRRKSRMGYALQNHLAELFAKHGLRYTPQAKTEGNNRPDFIFPGEKEYDNPLFNSSLLIMLGVKSTSKDRWRQVLTEADRIPDKHLCTLEQGISEKQTEEMIRQRLQLVIPSSLHQTFLPQQQKKLLTVGEFIEFVHIRQI